MKNISMKKVNVFIAAAEAGNFTLGARKVNISQPAAVSIIDEIEETVGAPLFERHGKTRRAKLTSRGEEVYETLVKALSVYDQALDSISYDPHKERKQTIFVQDPYLTIMSPLWFKSIQAQYDNFSLSVHTAQWDEIIGAFERREECIALIDGNVRPKNSQYFHVGSIEMVLAVPETCSYLEQHREHIEWEDLPDNTLIYSGVNPAALDQIYENIYLAKNKKQHFTEVNSINILCKFCQELEAPAIVPRVMAETCCEECKIRYLTFSHSKIHIPLGVSIPYGHYLGMRISTQNIQEVVYSKYLT